MSVFDKTGSNMAGAGGVAMAQTDDLKHILQQIAGQIATVEQRHAESMRDMQQRLAGLTTQAKQTLAETSDEPRQQVSQTAARQSISRIESGIADLAERITETATARREHRDAVVSQQNYHHSTPDVSEPWDPSSAEALTRLYETGDAGPVMTSYFFQDPPAPPRQSERTPTQPSTSTPVQIAAFAVPDRSRALRHEQAIIAPAAPVQTYVAKAIDSSEVLAKLASDRDWLEGRLADIATRVEVSLSNFKPEESLGQLHSRFDEFEARFTDAMSAVAQRSDLDGLVHLEAHIADLTRQFETTKAQFARLDEIEQQLRDLTAYAQEATEAPAMALPVIEPAPLPDFGELAEVTATRVSERLAALQRPDVADAGQVERVHDLLTAYMADRRRDESQTTSMLDTMQEALVRLIDRVDQMDATLLRAADTVAVSPTPSTAQATAATGPDGLRYVEDERGQRPGRRAGDLQSNESAPTVALAPAPSQAQPQQTQPQPQQPTGRPLSAEAAAALNAGAPWPQHAARPHDHETSESQRGTDAAPSRTRRRATLEPLSDVPTSSPMPAPPPVAPAAQQVGQPQAKSQPRPRPTPMQATVAAPEAKIGTDSIRKRGLMIAGIAFGLIAIGTISAKILTDQFDRSRVKQEQRVPIASPANPGMRGLSPAFETDSPVATPSMQDALPADQKAVPASQRGIADDRLKLQPEPREVPRPQNARPPSEASNPAPQLRPMPETVTDDLSENSKVDTLSRARAAAKLPGLMLAPVVQGITLQQPTGGLSPIDLAQLQQRQLGQTSRAPDANAASMSTASLQKPTVAIASEINFDPLLNGTGAAGVTAVEMPPLLIGPSSLRTAAQKGDPAAQFEIAARFAEGKGVKQDFKQAMIWYQRSAQAGFAPSQYRLATLYERGLGGKADQDRARAWYKRAADRGNVKAMHNLAVLSTGRDNVAPDYAAAAQWFTEAADRGLADSQFNLGVLYENGLGVPKDPSEAFKWFSLAAHGGDKEALKRRDQVGARMQPDDAKIAEAKVAGWRARPVDLKVNDARVAGDAWRAQNAQALEAAQVAVTPSASRNMVPAPSAAPRLLPTVRYGTPPTNPPKTAQNQ